MKRSFYYIIFLLLFGLVSFYGCASYKPTALPDLQPEFATYSENIENVTLACKALSTEECKTYFDRDIIAKGYQPVLMTIVNESNRSMLFSPEDVSIPVCSPQEVAEKCHTDTAGRATAYGIGALFLWPLVIPAIVDGVGSSEANTQLDRDFSEKNIQQLVINPYSTHNGVIFFSNEEYQDSFTVKLVDKETRQQLEYSVKGLDGHLSDDTGKDIEQSTKASDQPEEEQKLAPTPETAPTIKVTDQPTETPKVAAIPKEVSIARVSLRNKPKGIINEAEIKNMLVEYGFFDVSRYVLGSFENHFVDNKDGTITDKATGLMWQKRGSTNSLDNRAAKEYVKDLNRRRFAGHSNWRMPTIEELASLTKKTKTKGVHLDPVFDNNQTTCWSADQGVGRYRDYAGGWIVSFKNGEVRDAHFPPKRSGGYMGVGQAINYMNYVKAVRSIK
jgi:hypothetical protein